MADISTRTQKLIKVGNSFAVTLDPQFVKKIRSSLTLRYAEDGTFVTLVPTELYEGASQSGELKKEEKKAVMAAKVSPEFRMWVEKSLAEDAQSLKELANL